MKRRQPIRHWCEYIAFRIFVCLIDILPTSACVGLSRAMAFFVTRCLPRKWTRYKIARENIRQAFGDRKSDAEIDLMIHQMWIHLFRMVTEIVQLPRKIRLYNCADVVSFLGRNRIVRAMCSGRPVIIVTGHFGNWEIANVTLGLFGFHIGVVARDLDNPLLDRWFRRWREQTGTTMIPKKGGGGQIVEQLEQTNVVGMLCDQDAGRKGMFVPFFGKEASSYKSIALLAMQYRAVICVGYARRLPDSSRSNRWVRFELGCVDVIDPDDYQSGDAVRQITERYTRSLEEAIEMSPEQYFWLHRRWKSRPKERRNAVPRAA